ncbi:MAG: sugar-binding domain-containing protein [Melioribacteraceae bacterium]
MKRNTKKIVSALIVIIFFVSAQTFAQYKLNYGLSEPQAHSTLPKSKVEFQKASPKEKVQPKTILRKDINGSYAIIGGWELTEASKLNSAGDVVSSKEINTRKWYNATVPGTVLTTLVDQGVYPDPYFGLNNLAIPDTLCRQEWWYRTEFQIPEKEKNKNVWLTFEGINYKADVWLNGKLVGKIAGAFMRGVFDVTNEISKNGKNILAVHIFPPQNPGIPHEESPTAGTGPNGGKLCLDGPTFISSEGWDWIPGIRDRNIGIWRDVKMKFTDAVTIIDPQVITDLPLPDISSADVIIKTELKNSSSEAKIVSLKGKIGKINFSKKVQLDANSVTKIEVSPKEFSQLKIKIPKLWWPNGYGKPELYNLELSVTINGKKSDQKNIRFGIREFSYEITADNTEKQNIRVEFNPTSDLINGNPVFDNINRRDVGEGVSIPMIVSGANWLKAIPLDEMAPYLVVKVNGQRIFCKGGNWGMDDGMKRVRRDLLEPYFKLHKEANFTMIRNWTGESTEELFYDLADEYGLLVWNDFWLSTEGYNLEPTDNKLFMENVEDVVKRFRNHASLVIWCPRNEGYAPVAIENEIAKVIASEDGTRLYQGNSRYLNLRPSGPWHYFKDPADYFRNNASGFNTELGTPSIPTAESMKKMMPKEDVWPISDTWFYHDLHNGQKEFRAAIDSLYGSPNNVDEFCTRAQMINYESHRAMFESWNSRLWNNTSGILLWMTHPAWPSTVWQVYSWDYETFGSYFASKSACEPLHVQMNLHDNKVSVVNTTLDNFENAEVNLEILDVNGKSLFTQKLKKNIKANELNYFFTPDMPANLPEVFLARLTLSDTRGKVLSRNDYWKTSSKNGDYKKLNTLGQAVIKGKQIELNKKEHKLKFVLENTSNEIAIAVKLNLTDKENKVILPAYFSDGYFNLLPNEKREVTVVCDQIQNKSFKVRASGYNLNENVIFEIN